MGKTKAVGKNVMNSSNLYMTPTSVIENFGKANENIETVYNDGWIKIREPQRRKVTLHSNV